MTYRIGDRVRVLDRPDNAHIHIGRIGTVTSVETRTVFPCVGPQEWIRVHFDEEVYDHWFNTYKLESM